MNNTIQTIEQSHFQDTFLDPLLQIHDCPQRMHYIGNLPQRTDTRFITIVGSRAHSNYAKQALEYLFAGLAGYPICIISGLALGTDALAHRLAIKHSLPTIAVPGSGLDASVMYPATNKPLAQEILRTGGALLSEFEPTIRAAQWTFPQRNRIMARLADLVLVVEAGEKSGTLITARNALEYNVELATIPAGICTETGRGSNDLLRHGAQAILSSEDILNLLGINPVAVPKKTYDDVGDDERAVLDVLLQPRSRSDLIEMLDFDMVQLSTIISLLEIKGHVKEELGSVYKI